MAGWTGLEPATFCVTGRRSNQLSYHPVREELANVQIHRGQVKRRFLNCPGFERLTSKRSDPNRILPFAMVSPRWCGREGWPTPHGRNVVWVLSPRSIQKSGR